MKQQGNKNIKQSSLKQKETQEAKSKRLGTKEDELGSFGSKGFGLKGGKRKP